MAEFEDLVLDLSDDAAAVYCLSCGAPFVHGVEECHSCHGRTFAARELLLHKLLLSAPRAGQAIRKGRLGVFLEDDAHRARLEFGRLPENSPVPPADASWLCDADDGMELLAIQAVLLDAGIPSFRREALVELGLPAGAAGKLPVFVSEAVLADARRVLDEWAAEPAHAPDTDEPEQWRPAEAPAATSERARAVPAIDAPGLPWPALVAVGLALLFLCRIRFGRS